MQNTSAMSEKEFEKAVKKSVVLYLNKGNILLYGEKSYISDNREITPYKNGDDIYLPVDKLWVNMRFGLSFMIGSQWRD